MIKKIAIAMSLRNTDAGAFELASGMAFAPDAELIVVSIIRTRDVDRIGAVASRGYPVSPRDYVRKIFDQRMETLKHSSGRLSFPETNLRPIIRVGDPVSEFLRVVSDETPDMVIVGESRRLSPEGLFRSSFTRAVLKKSPVSVAVARGNRMDAYGKNSP